MFGTSSGVDVRLMDVRPGDVMSVDMRPADVRPVDVRPADVRPVIRVRGARFAWRSFPNGLYQKKAKIDVGVSSLGKIGEVGISRDHPVPVLLGARLGRGSLELVEIFQMSM